MPACFPYTCVRARERERDREKGREGERTGPEKAGRTTDSKQTTPVGALSQQSPPSRLRWTQCESFRSPVITDLYQRLFLIIYHYQTLQLNATRGC